VRQKKNKGNGIEEVYHSHSASLAATSFFHFPNVVLSHNSSCFAWLLFGLLPALRGLCHAPPGARAESPRLWHLPTSTSTSTPKRKFYCYFPQVRAGAPLYIGHKICHMKNVAHTTNSGMTGPGLPFVGRFIDWFSSVLRLPSHRFAAPPMQFQLCTHK